LIAGHDEVVDADLSEYFDSIPHAELLKAVARRVSDGSLLALIKGWLEAPVEASDERGHTQRTTRNKDEGRGTPQGAPLSPLLANLYMRRFIRGWKVLGHEQRLDAHIVNYADDFVICCRGTATRACAVMRDMMTRLRLTVNETKTRVCSAAETFDFLGYTIGVLYAPQTGKPYHGVKPSATKVQRLCRDLRAMTDRRWLWLSEAEQIARLNRCVDGWANYFCLGTITKAYRQVTVYLRHRVRQWLVRKRQEQGSKRSGYSDTYLHETLGLLRLRRRTHGYSWATV
jgi:RNA-directed DNA polymerase